MRLANFNVIIRNVSLMVTADQLVQSTCFISCGQFSGYPAAGATGHVTCRPGPIRGRFVYITLPRTETLTLCEVMIMSTGGTHLFHRPSVNSKYGFTFKGQPKVTLPTINAARSSSY